MCFASGKGYRFGSDEAVRADGKSVRSNTSKTSRFGDCTVSAWSVSQTSVI